MTCSDTVHPWMGIKCGSGVFLHFLNKICVTQTAEELYSWHMKCFWYKAHCGSVSFGAWPKEISVFSSGNWVTSSKNSDCINSDVNWARIHTFACIYFVYLQYIKPIIWTLWSNRCVFQELKLLRSNLIFTTWIIWGCTI